MTNNDIFRRIRYIFDFTDSKMINLFAQAGVEVTRAQISDWLKKEDDPAHKGIYDKDLAIFLNGLINDKRGKKEGEQPKPEKTLTNNLILRKLKIALNLKSEDMVAIFDSVGFKVGPHELSAFFRKPTQKQYRLCKDQFLREFLYGLQKKYRGDK